MELKTSEQRWVKSMNEFLFPFHQFKDCGAGSNKQRHLAYCYNRSIRHLLLPSINNWALSSCILLIILKLLSQTKVSVYWEASAAVMMTLAILGMVVQVVMWMHLTFVKEA